MTGRAWSVILLLVLAIVGVASVWLRCEGEPPTLRGPDALALGKQAIEVEIEAADPGSGVQSLDVRVRHAGGETPLAQRRYPGNPFVGNRHGRLRSETLTLDAAALGLREGSAFLVAEATDWSWRNWARGNTAVLEIPLEIDLTPPRVSVENGLTYVKRGGASVVTWRAEGATRDGVQVGRVFFPGHDLGGGRRGALFAIPRDAEAPVRVRVVAEDAAGNRRESSWPVRVQERKFEDVTIRLGPSFLEGKVPELAGELGVAGEPLEAFQRINRDERAAIEARIREIVSGAAGERLFTGSFRQQSNSAVTSRFAEHRTYLVDGEPVSEAIHYGYDLASTAGAPIEAGARGEVIHAGPLGIYGDTVILSHGLGLTSLYAHLSRIDVGNGDVVEQGETVGLSGSTGLAGGDHLHFAILVGGTYVDPVEWWDAKWVRDHVQTRLDAKDPEDATPR